MEHRWGRRQSTDLRVRFISRTKIGTGCLSNVSVTGAFMKTKVHLRLLSVLYLSIASHAKKKAKAKGMAAFVVRQDSVGVGLEWCEAGQTCIEARLALLADDLIDSKAGAPITAGEKISTAGHVRRREVTRWRWSENKRDLI
jgi:hypothetical protein